MFGDIDDLGAGPYLPRVPLVPPTAANQRSPSGVGVSTPRGSIDFGDYRFRPRVVGVVDIYN